MKKTFIIALLFGATNLLAQQQQDSILIKQILELKVQVNQQQKEIKNISLELDKNYWTYRGVKNETQERITRQKNTIDSLNTLIQNNSQTIETSTSQFGTEIEKVTSTTKTQIAQLDNSVDKNRLYWIIATLATVLLGGLVYWLLGKRIQSSKTDVETQIKNTKTALEEESVKLDNKLVDVLTKQLEVLKADTSKPQTANENDHSLVLKVADRLNSMEKNLSRMDSKIKGHKNLSMAIKNIKDNYAANGYEIVEMLGKDYSEGMKATVNFVQDEDFIDGKRIITRIIKPQVNYKGTMIQTAQIEVTEA
jgi:hypothetical protein